MAMKVVDNGQDNLVVIEAGVVTTSDCTIILNGSRITVEIAEGCWLSGAVINLGNDCTFRVGAGCRLACLELVASGGGSVSIGPFCNFTWHTRLLMHEPGCITFGTDCLVASETLFTVSDMHSIIDRGTGRRINPAADIVIGDRVWIAHAATILKGSTIGEGSIIGLGAVVSGSVGAHCLVSGVPARVLRENVTWDRTLLPT